MSYERELNPLTFLREESDSGDGLFTDNGLFSDDVFARRRIPWKGIALAVVLLLAGALSILFGSIFLYSDVTADRHGFALLILGFLMFVPGAYHTVIAYKAFMGRPGFSFSALPEV
mmetsp:Transcript_29704/g.64863  ORF Transcript_29704/g.64863 Transcript_29704/m.64863 type:complete len:116 (+) Transcript_29704:226-573(+)